MTHGIKNATLSVVRRKIRAITLSRVLGIMGLLLVVGLPSYFAYHFWLVMTDSLGTFHAATDTADVDGDGDLDVVLHNVRQEAEFTAFSVWTLWINQGDGRFTPRDVDESGRASGGWASAAGDVDGDGDADLALFIGYELRLLLNLGGAQGGEAGAFRQAAVLRPPQRDAQFGSVHLDDLNQDGWLDVVVTGCCGRVFVMDLDDDTPNYSWYWINHWGERNLLGERFALSALEGLALSGAALDDLDGDGDVDLFAAVIAPPEGRNRDPADRIVFNDGTGRFADSGQRLGDRDSTAVALGDLDGDGDVDALVGEERGAAVWINQGRAQGGQEGQFALSGEKIAGGETRSLFLSDFDGDGDRDVLVGERRQATIWWNDGRATFTGSDRRFRYSKKHGLSVGDFDGDGWPDIFAAAYDDGYRLWLNRGDGAFSRYLFGREW